MSVLKFMQTANEQFFKNNNFFKKDNQAHPIKFSCAMFCYFQGFAPE